MPSFYRCENEFGDPCTFAKDNRKIPDNEVTQSMDGSAPKCPGKTRSGKTCGCELVHLPPPPVLLWKKILIAVGGILVVAGLIWFVLRGSTSPDTVQDEIGSQESSVTIPPTTKQDDVERDPWWIYQQLETSSKILRTEP